MEVLTVQETKLTDDRLPVAELAAAGDAAHFVGQKTCNGVAILIASYAGAIVTADEHAVSAVCVIDSRPGQCDHSKLSSLEALAGYASHLMSTR